jgi:Domain of unknown function (DUF1851)
MNLRDYLIDCSRFDWRKLFASWHWLLPSEFTTWIMNRFGDLFLETPDGKIHRLALDDGSLTVLAGSKDQFCGKLDEQEVANDWLLIPLVDELVEVGKVLKEGQCYSFIQIPILGGDYLVENVAVRDVVYQYAALGPIFEKLKDVPDGTQVNFEIKKPPGSD